MAAIPTRFIAAVGAFGAVDGYLERQDTTWASRQPAGANIPASNRSTDWKKRYSTYAEVGGAVAGAFLLQRARSPMQSDVGLGLMAASIAALGRKGGIYVAETQEPAGYTGVPRGQAEVYAPHTVGAGGGRAVGGGRPMQPYYTGISQNRTTERTLQMAI